MAVWRSSDTALFPEFVVSSAFWSYKFNLGRFINLFDLLCFPHQCTLDMALKDKSRPDTSMDSSAPNSRSRKLRKSFSSVFRWRSHPKNLLNVQDTGSSVGSIDTGDDRDLEIERARARLEGRSEDSFSSSSSPSSLFSGSRRNTADSVSSGVDSFSYRSSCRRSPLDVVFEDSDASDDLPNYSFAVYPREPVTYRFSQCSPYALVLVNDDGTAQPRYHISVGLNVWMPTAFTTTIREGGSNHGRLVAQLE